MEKLFNIQFFAEDEVETETPTEEVENDTAEDDAVDFDDTSDEDVETSEEVEQEEEPVKEEPKAQPKTTRKDNFNNAQRRINERRERELAEARKKSYLEGIKDAIGGTNPYTQEKIEDEFDVEVLKTMREMEAKGFDPIEDYAKYSVTKMREQKKIEAERLAEESKKNEQINKELADFDKAHGQGSAERILNDELFSTKYAQYLGRLSLEETYQLFADQQAQIEMKAEQKAIRQQAINKSTPGAPGKASVKEKTYSNMSKDEFREEFNKMLGNY